MLAEAFESCRAKISPFGSAWERELLAFVYACWIGGWPEHGKASGCFGVRADECDE